MTAPIESATDPGRQLEFDDAFRRRLRELLTWRRDVRRFRRDTLPSGALERLIGLACLAPSVGLSQPWRFVLVDTPACRAAIRANFEKCNAKALAEQSGERAAGYARLKLAGLDDAPGHLAVFSDPATTRGHGLGRHTMPEMIEYSAVTAVHTILDVPAAWKFIGYLCLGFPKTEDDVPELERAGWEQRYPASSLVVLRR